MPKIKSTTLFCKRTLPILLIDDTKQDSLMKASMLTQPIASELVKQIPRVTHDIVHVNETGNPIFNALNTINALLSISKPTIVVAPGIDDEVRGGGVTSVNNRLSDTAKALFSYIQFLVAAGGGFIIHVNCKEGEHEMNPALPVLQFNADTDGYMDIDYKVAALIKTVSTPEVIDHAMTVQSVVNTPWPKNKLGLVLGSWGRDLVAVENETDTLTHIINVKGVAGTPISVEEYVNKVWCSGIIDHKLLNPVNTLIVRNPSIESKLVLSKLLSSSGKSVKGLTFLEA